MGGHDELCIAYTRKRGRRQHKWAAEAARARPFDAGCGVETTIEREQKY